MSSRVGGLRAEETHAPKAYGGLKVEQAGKMKDLERGNARLRPAAALSPEEQALADVASGGL